MSSPSTLNKRVCRLEDLPTGDKFDALGFAASHPARPGIFVMRHGDEVKAYVNCCPHLGTPLNWSPDRFMDLERTNIVCATHGAEFRVDSGECISGPCLGDMLEPVEVEVRDGVVYVADWDAKD